MTTLEPIEGILRGQRFKKQTLMAFEEMQKKYGLKYIEIEILLYLDRFPDATMGEIHRKMDMNKGQISVAVDHLQQMGFLNMLQDPNDRRYYTYVLTDKAKAFLVEAVEAKTKVHQVLFAGFTEEELYWLEHIMKKIWDNMEENA